MQEYHFVKIKKDLQQIVDMLLLNGTLTESPGLVSGKIGIAIFFFHYAQFTKNNLFADYAMDLIDEMLNQIHINSPADYAEGLAGIGVGIDYMIRNNFLNVKEDICEDFDQRIVRVVYDPSQNFSLYGGLIGYGRYWLTRLNYKSSVILAQKCLTRILTLIGENFSNISVSEQTDVFCFLNDLQKISDFDCCNILLEKIQRNLNFYSSDIIQSFPRLGDSVITDIVSSYHRNSYFNNALQCKIDVVLKHIPDLDIEKVPIGTGLLNGYAGEGMLRLTVLEQTNMLWMKLL